MRVTGCVCAYSCDNAAAPVMCLFIGVRGRTYLCALPAVFAELCLVRSCARSLHIFCKKVGSNESNNDMVNGAQLPLINKQDAEMNSLRPTLPNNRPVFPHKHVTLYTVFLHYTLKA